MFSHQKTENAYSSDIKGLLPSKHKLYVTYPVMAGNKKVISSASSVPEGVLRDNQVKVLVQVFDQICATVRIRNVQSFFLLSYPSWLHSCFSITVSINHPNSPYFIYSTQTYLSLTNFSKKTCITDTTVGNGINFVIQHHERNNISIFKPLTSRDYYCKTTIYD